MTISKETYRSGPYQDFFAQGVKVGDTLYMAGQIGINAEGQPGETLTKQVELAYDHIRQVLAEFGATPENLVDETWYVTDMEGLKQQIEPIFIARAEFYGDIPQVCQTVVQVAGLIEPELLVEIKCVAKV